MDIRSISNLLSMIEKSSFSSFQLETSEITISIFKDNKKHSTSMYSSEYMLKSKDEICATTQDNNLTESKCKNFNECKVETIRSQYVGIFRNNEQNGCKPKIEVGSKVVKGQILGFVEFLRILTDIKINCNGQIVEICCVEGQLVEYGQVMFRINISNE